MSVSLEVSPARSDVSVIALVGFAHAVSHFFHLFIPAVPVSASVFLCFVGANGAHLKRYIEVRHDLSDRRKPSCQLSRAAHGTPVRFSRCCAVVAFGVSP